MMVSFSPIEVIIRTTSFGLGLVKRSSSSPTTDVAIHSQGWRDTSAGQQQGRTEQHELTNAIGAGQGVPQGPGPTQGARKRECVELQLVESLVQELDCSVAEAHAGNAGGVARPEPRPVYDDPPQSFEALEQGEAAARRCCSHGGARREGPCLPR